MTNEESPSVEKENNNNLKIIKKDLHWTNNNKMTLLNWIAIATFNIDCLELAIIRYRNWMRQHVILGIVLSTTSGTLSVTQYGNISSTNINFVLNFFFTVFSFAVAISTGCIKVYQVQERLEKFITVKQEWIVFITKIATQFQLNVDLRKDALDLINSNKDKYLDLLKIDNEIPDFIKKKVKDKFLYKKNNLYLKDFHPSLEIGEAMSISDIIMNIGYVEGKNLSFLEKEKKEKLERNLENLKYDEEEIDYYYDNIRNCISRNGSIDYTNNEKKDNTELNTSIGDILHSLPSFFQKKDEKDGNI
jgi:hypothetical protein